VSDSVGDVWLVGLLGAVFGGGGLWAFLSERTRARRSSPAAMVTAEGEFAEKAAEVSRRIGEAAAGLVDDLRQELKFVRGQVDELRTKVDACELRHRECEAATARLQAEIDRLMRDSPPASY